MYLHTLYIFVMIISSPLQGTSLGARPIKHLLSAVTVFCDIGVLLVNYQRKFCWQQKLFRCAHKWWTPTSMVSETVQFGDVLGAWNFLRTYPLCIMVSSYPLQGWVFDSGNLRDHRFEALSVAMASPLDPGERSWLEVGWCLLGKVGSGRSTMNHSYWGRKHELLMAKFWETY